MTARAVECCVLYCVGSCMSIELHCQVLCEVGNLQLLLQAVHNSYCSCVKCASSCAWVRYPGAFHGQSSSTMVIVQTSLVLDFAMLTRSFNVSVVAQLQIGAVIRGHVDENTSSH